MKRISVIILILLFIVPSFVNAETVQSGKFKYIPAFEEEAKEEVYYYSDDYFKESGKTNNEHLLAMSYNLAISTFEEQNSSYTEALLTEIGFQDLEALDIKGKPTLDTIGTVIGHKEAGGKNLIAVAIRGANYESEWGNNFVVGSSGNAKGFDGASQKVIKRLEDYIAKNNLYNVQIWMVGYSRGGAVADLAGAYINKNLDDFKTTADDIFVYTFEAPAASVEDATYENIYNVRDKNDLIPMVYPEEWGFSTSGKEIIIDDDESITTYIGLLEQEEYKDVSINEFNNQLTSWLTSRLSRETYSEQLEEPISKILDIYFSKSDEDREKLKNFILEDVKGNIIDNEDNFNILKSKLWSILGHNSDYLYQDVTNELIRMLDEVRDTPNASVLTDEEYNAIKSALYPVLRVVGPIIIDDTNYYDGVEYDRYYKEYVEDYYLPDDEMGAKYGADIGKFTGYDDGIYGNPKNENSYEFYDDYGPDYEEAYKKAYVSAYLEYYELGKLHSEDLAARGRYDGAKYSYYAGYSAASYGDEKVPYDEYFYEEDWMTDEYIEAYNASYEEEYLKGYEEGLINPEQEKEDPKLLALYHFMSLYKNVSSIIQHHYPQHVLGLIHNMDSYYTEGPPKQEEESKDSEKEEVSPEEKSAAPKTGDENDAALWMGILMAASLGLLYKEKLSEDLLQVRMNMSGRRNYGTRNIAHRKRNT